MSKDDKNREATGVPGSDDNRQAPDSKPDPGVPHRRRFLSTLLVAGALAYAKPSIVTAQTGIGLSPGSPMSLPFHLSGPMPGGPFAGTVGTSVYNFTGTVTVDIATDGHVTVQNAILTGAHVSGPDKGVVTLTQGAPATGTYVGTTLDVPSGAMTYQDNAGSQPVTAKATGTLTKQENKVGINTGDIHVNVNKKKGANS